MRIKNKGVSGFCGWEQGTSAFVIARTTDEEAQAELEQLMALQKFEEHL